MTSPSDNPICHWREQTGIVAGVVQGREFPGMWEVLGSIPGTVNTEVLRLASLTQCFSVDSRHCCGSHIWLCSGL